MSLQGAIEAIQAHALSLSSVKYAPPSATGSASLVPFVMTYPTYGRLTSLTAGDKREIHTLYTEFFISQAITPIAVETAVNTIGEFVNLLLNDPTLGGEVSTIVMQEADTLRYTFGVLRWNDQDYLGIRYEIPIKIQEATV